MRHRIESILYEKEFIKNIMDYYEKREENFIVGIIDKKTSSAEGTKDIFKIREPRAKILDKKRGTGIPTLKGAVCSTSKDKNYLLKILNKIPNSKYIENKFENTFGWYW